MTDEEIRKLARYAAENLYKGYKEKNISLMEDEFRMLISFILKEHCIVEKSVIKDDYADIKKAVAEWEASELTERDNYFEYGRVFGNKEVLESYFSKDDLIREEAEK